MTQRYRALRGTKDILPDETARWQLVEEVTRRVFGRYGFREIRTPILEPLALFVRSVGASSDVVRKEMYTIESADEPICLRPEATASVARAFVEHSLHRGVAAGYPERFFYVGPMFRYERPQKGRQRQFHQIGVEVLGAPEAGADAETIEMADSFFETLAIRPREIVLGSVGDEACRPRFREELRAWLEPRLGRLCADCRRRHAENPLRVFDCKVEEDREILASAPTMFELLCEPCASHFGEVRSLLDDWGVAYRVEPHLVRGLDYYRRTVFEVLSADLGAQNSLLGGGRYDGLVAELGGPSVAAFGFSIGMERVVLLLPEERVPAPTVDLALVSLGREAWRESLRLARRLRRAGVGCVTPTSERPMGAQLRRADRLGARFVLFVGQEEIATGRYGLKDLRTGEQESLEEGAVVARLVRRSET
jgi:histidyl-tRNA synthetase